MTDDRIHLTIGDVVKAIDHIKTKPMWHLMTQEQKENVLRARCPECEKDIRFFDDLASYDEYLISGMCQVCQDKFFDLFHLLCQD